MKICVFSDPHFGKTIYGMSMIEDQRIWIEGFVEKMKALKPDAIAIAGDVYDRTQPSDEAVELFDLLIRELAKLDTQVMVVAGNHDSARKLSVHSALLNSYGVHIAGVPSKKLEKVTLTDEFGEVDFYLMPYIYPLCVRTILEDESIRDFTTAAARLLEAQNIDQSRRTVLIAHQNVTADGQEAERGGSETSVGGISGIDYSVFDGFDYVALGHIHGDSSVGREEVRYCGTPMCYHFNETRQKEKGALLVTMAGDGTITTEKIVIETKHKLVEVHDDFEKVCEILRNAPEHTWFRVILKDRRNGAEEINIMRSILAQREDRYLLEHDSDKRHADFEMSSTKANDAHNKSVAELFSEFYSACGTGGAEAMEEDVLLFKYLESTMEHRYGDGKDPSDEAINDIVNYLIKQGENV